MTIQIRVIGLAALGVWLALGLGARGDERPAARPGDWIARDFRFHTGEVMPELHLHYTTIGSPSGEPVLVLHGTGGSGAGLLGPAFGGVLFGPGQPLDAAKYYIILPDAIGTGGSSKPSDGLRAKFPHYDYADMIAAQDRLITDGLGVRHLRLVLGYSMGGMETWLWGETYPGMMDALVPMASQPGPMAGRNWMLRRMLIESIKADPAFNGGDYSTEPASLRTASLLFDLATNGGTLGLQARGDDHAAADAYVTERLAGPAPADANDIIDQWNASADYDPSAGLGRIVAPVLAINSADDERNPSETGVMAHGIAQLKTASVLLVPGSRDTHGHGTLAFASLWSEQLRDFLARVPHPPR